MKNIKFFTQAMFSACLLIGALVACSSEDITNDTPQGEGKGVQFTFSFQDFEKDEQVTSRAAADNVLGRDTVDIDNNIEAEVIIKSDNTPASMAATRTTLSNGHYTVVAYQGSAVKGTLKGTWNGSTMVPDAGYKNEMQLPAGTYTFVCFNDKITQNGGTLTLTRSSSGNAALLGINKNVAVSGLKQSVSFVMKHAESRMKIRLSMYSGFTWNSNVYSGISTTLSSLNATDIPATANYDVATGIWSNAGGAAVSEADINNSTQSADYHYFLPSTSGSSFKLTFNSGTVYRREMAGKSLKLFTTRTLNMQPNKSYNVEIALHYKFTYLFSDGTTGILSTNPAKTPIGLVINGNKRIAAALNEASTSALWTTRSGKQNINSCSAVYPYETVSGTSAYDGYNETWNAAYSTDGTTVKGTSADFPAFKAAAEYNPGVPTAPNIGKWYLPAAGEFTKYLQDTLTIGNLVQWSNTFSWAFTRAGGTKWYTPIIFTEGGGLSSMQMENAYSTSSELDNDNVLGYFLTLFVNMYSGTTSFAVAYPNSKTITKRVRPFVHY